MLTLLGFVVFTSNILGSFNDPFEFEGDYGNEANLVRSYVFEQVAPKEDFNYGPTLQELITPDLVERLQNKQQQLQDAGFQKFDLTHFITRYGDQKLFSFLRHSPPALLSLDKILHDKAAREGKAFDLPILSSTAPLKGNNALELKAMLLEALFTQENLKLAKPAKELQAAINAFDSTYQGAKVDKEDLAAFTSPAGQVFFYWLYQSMNLHLIAENEAMIPQINKVKQNFAKTLGNPSARAEQFRDKLVKANASVVFTQESDAIVPQKLTKEGLFHSAASQNPLDGTFVFLRSDQWEPAYQIIPIEDYEGYAKGKMNVILATRKDNGEKFLLASGHGNSTRPEDGRLQLLKIAEKFHDLAKLPENQGLQLVIGIDANTKSETDVEMLRDHLHSLGLVATDAGPTTIKKRMVTTQHAKSGRQAVDEEDFVIILLPENGGHYQMTHLTVGFKEEKPDPAVSLPNVNNPSDHYPVGVTLEPVRPSSIR